MWHVFLQRPQGFLVISILFSIHPLLLRIWVLTVKVCETVNSLKTRDYFSSTCPLHPLVLLKAQSVDQQHGHRLGACRLPCWLSGQESACSGGTTGDMGSVPGSDPPRSPGRGHGNPLLYSCLENLHGQRSLVGYSPWYHKESDMTAVT